MDDSSQRDSTAGKVDFYFMDLYYVLCTVKWTTNYLLHM